MSRVFYIFLSMSFSGSLLFLGLLFLKPWLQNRISRQWQYYAWLVVIARLLLPVTPGISLAGNLFQWAGQAVTPSSSYAEEDGRLFLSWLQGNAGAEQCPIPHMLRNSKPGGDELMQDGNISVSVGLPQEGNAFGSAGLPREGNAFGSAGLPRESNVSGSATFPQEDNNPGNAELLQSGKVPGAGLLPGAVLRFLWMLWLAGVLVLLVRKITAYQSFVKYMKTGCEAVEEPALLDLLALEGERAGVRRPIELYGNSQASSPMLLGCFRPCIILPDPGLPREDFLCTVRHELCHYRRRDLFYKWLVQITVCLHWFNPLVHMMGQEISRACELSCDEAVVWSLDEKGRRAYGDTLLRAVAPKKDGKECAASVMLGESAVLLKERLDAIMKFRKMSRSSRCAMLLLTAALGLGFTATGAYAAGENGSGKGVNEKHAETLSENVPPVSGENNEEEVEIETITFKDTTYYLIFNEEQLRAIGTGTYGMDLDYLQQGHIQLSEEEWIPIGTEDHPFTGSYNGNGFEISGLTACLFGVAEDAHLYNINLRDYEIPGLEEKTPEWSHSPILAQEKGDVRCYDNFVYPKEKSEQTSAPGASGPAALAESSYAQGDVGQFSKVFFQLNRKTQEAWLERSFEDREIAFFSVCLWDLWEDCPTALALAEEIYQAKEIAFFSVLADEGLSQQTLENWLDQATMDKRTDFQMVLLEALDRDWEAEALEAELKLQRLAEYEAVGIVGSGHVYEYLGQPVNILLDHQAGSQSYFLNMNPAGTVNIKITRGADGRIESVDYMTEEEVDKLCNGYDE